MSDVSVIVPTRALSQRAALIRRALDSILSQEGVRVAPLVVVNGTDRDAALIRELQSDRRLSLVFRDEPHLPRALRAGFERVATPWVTALDDDDELLPGALAARVAALHANPDWDAVVSNGVVRDGHRDVMSIADVETVRLDPIRAMMRTNWMLPGAWLCRTEVMTPELFGAMPEHLECTYLGLWLATRCRLGFLERPTLIWRKDTPASVSKSRAYLLGQAEALRRLLAFDLPADVRADLERRISHACHAAARRCLSEGATGDAWDWHIRALASPGGWRHAGYTVRLLVALLGISR